MTADMEEALGMVQALRAALGLVLDKQMDRAEAELVRAEAAALLRRHDRPDDEMDLEEADNK